MPPDPRLAGVRRLRAGLLIAAVVLPSTCAVVGERQARRMEALAETGLPVMGRVSRVTETGRGSTHYTYLVAGTEYQWSVARDALPLPVDAPVSVIYLPTDPSLSRPVARRELLVGEGWRTRRTLGIAAGVAALLLGALTFAAHRDVKRMTNPAPPPVDAAGAYRKRMQRTAAKVALLLTLVSVARATLAREPGQPVLLEVISWLMLVTLSTLIFWYFAYKSRTATPIASQTPEGIAPQPRPPAPLADLLRFLMGA